MKLRLQFWQKAFFCILVCFLICYNIAAYLIVQKSYEMSRENEIATAENEFYAIRKSVSERIQSILSYYTELNKYNIYQYIVPYSDYYARQGIYIGVYINNELVYTGFNGDIPPDISVSEAGQFYNINDGLYLLFADYMDVPDTDLVFVYIKDVGKLAEFQQDIADYVVRTGTAVSIGLSALLILMLRELTRPVRILNKAAQAIAKGNYQERAVIKSQDEIGEFAVVFNSMAENIEAHIQKLSGITEEKQRFIDNLSHEMRTPVAAVLGYGELLKNANIAEEERLKAIDYIINQSLRLQNLSAKLMELSSMKHSQIKMKPVCLNRIIQQARNTLQRQSKEKNIDFEVNLNANLLTGDSDLLESLFQNLFENAIRVLDQGGKIKINAENVQGGVQVTVEDNGPGIPETELEKILEPFYRIDKARNHTNGGAGLGLSICKLICHIHNGEMRIESKPGAGTKMEIYFTS